MNNMHKSDTVIIIKTIIIIYVTKTTNTCTELHHFLFNMQTPTYFGSGLPSSGSFLDSSELLEMQIEWVVYNIMYVYVDCVPECCGSLQHPVTQAT
jgi:hypothetical protein